MLPDFGSLVVQESREEMVTSLVLRFSGLIVQGGLSTYRIRTT